MSKNFSLYHFYIGIENYRKKAEKTAEKEAASSGGESIPPFSAYQAHPGNRQPV